VRNELAILEKNGLVTIEADYNRLCQLLENLFRNAIDHGGEAVTVRVGNMDDGFYIEDTGVRCQKMTVRKYSRLGTQLRRMELDSVWVSSSRLLKHGWTISVTEGTQVGLVSRLPELKSMLKRIRLVRFIDVGDVCAVSL